MHAANQTSVDPPRCIIPRRLSTAFYFLRSPFPSQCRIAQRCPISHGPALEAQWLQAPGTGTWGLGPKIQVAVNASTTPLPSARMGLLTRLLWVAGESYALHTTLKEILKLQQRCYSRRVLFSNFARRREMDGGLFVVFLDIVLGRGKRDDL